MEELFRVVYDRPLSPEAAAALTRRTGGWAAGLQLFHLATATRSRPEREQAVQELSGRSRLIRSYLAGNVLEGLPAERRSFLLRTCTLGVLTGEACDALLETTGSAVVLDELERLQLFTTSTDGGVTYRYHQVLQAYLEAVLVDELGGAAARALYSRSAVLLEQSGQTAAAVRAHARAEDWGAVGRLLQHSAPSLPADDDRLWALTGLPGGPGRRPRAAGRQRPPAVAGRPGRRRGGRVPAGGGSDGRAGVPGSLGRRAGGRRDLAARRRAGAGPAAQPGPGRPAGPRAPAAAPVGPECRAARPPAWPAGSPSCCPAGGRTPAATLLRALDRPALASWERLALRLTLQLAQLGEPDPGAAGQLEEIILSADAAGLSWLSRVARGLQAAQLLMTDPAPWRVATCADLVSDCERHGDRWATCLLAGVVGFAYAQVGQDEEAGSSCAGPRRRRGGLHAPVLEVWATAFALEIGLRARRASARRPRLQRSAGGRNGWARSA